MSFNSLEYVFFLPLIVALYYLTPHRFRWILLLAGSYLFYLFSRPEYLVLIIISTLVDYAAGLLMGKTQLRAKRKRYLILSLVINLGLLFVFKYLDFAGDTINGLLQLANCASSIPHFNLLLPLGISFYTFQTLSYTIDVYRGVREPEKHLGIFAVYVSFFPQLVAGPIERSTQLLPQFYQKHFFSIRSGVDGISLVLWGFFKKLVVADRLALYVDTVYRDPTLYSGPASLLASFFFLVQIYCDFSAYSDIAVGSAQILGFKINRNFIRPLFSRTISEVWARWHISLTTWVRDYLVAGLSQSAFLKNRNNLLTMIAMLAVGLWHGASWTFVLWGATYGGYLVFARWTRDRRQRIAEFLRLTQFPLLHHVLQVLMVLSLRVFTAILFRSQSMGEFGEVIKNILLGNQARYPGILLGQIDPYEFTISLCALLLLFVVEGVQEYKWERGKVSLREYFSGFPVLVRWPIYYLLIGFILMFGEFNLTGFIYFYF